MIRALIADDEPLAREGMRVRLDLERDVEVVGEATDGQETVDLVRRLRPDLLFLDVQMPGLDGFEVLRRIDAEALPIVVFVTAYDAYALRAFEAQALDYVLKPVDRARFLATLRRARVELQRTETIVHHESIRRLLECGPVRAEKHGRAEPSGGHLTRLAVEDGGRYLLLEAREIDYLEAAGNYVLVQARRRRFQVRGPLKLMAQRLDPNVFVQIHRSTILNVARVNEIRPEWHGDYVVILHDGTKLRLSRTYRRNLLP